MIRLALIGGAIALTVIGGLWHLYRATDKRADAAEAALRVRDANEKVVVEYVEKVVKVPGPERIKRVVDRVCHNLALPDSVSADAAAGADADFRPDSEGIAKDIRACEINKYRLEAIQETLRNQGVGK